LCSHLWGRCENWCARTTIDLHKFTTARLFAYGHVVVRATHSLTLAITTITTTATITTTTTHNHHSPAPQPSHKLCCAAARSVKTNPVPRVLLSVHFVVSVGRPSSEAAPNRQHASRGRQHSPIIIDQVSSSAFHDTIVCGIIKFVCGWKRVSVQQVRVHQPERISLAEAPQGAWFIRAWLCRLRSDDVARRDSFCFL
jgi:hypothetical protein